VKRISSLKAGARRVKRDVTALPWYAKAVAAAVAAYALSPIDPTLDFIPVLGHLDELVVLPLGIMLSVKLVPPQINGRASRGRDGSRAQAHEPRGSGDDPRNLDRRDRTVGLGLLG
jgi:uncharacterized membrane protein YkvA (DUF1232 family)